MDNKIFEICDPTNGNITFKMYGPEEAPEAQSICSDHSWLPIARLNTSGEPNCIYLNPEKSITAVAIELSDDGNLCIAKPAAMLVSAICANGECAYIVVTEKQKTKFILRPQRMLQ